MPSRHAAVVVAILANFSYGSALTFSFNWADASGGNLMPGHTANISG